jgi:hypothetical protein
MDPDPGGPETCGSGSGTLVSPLLDVSFFRPPFLCFGAAKIFLKFASTVQVICPTAPVIPITLNLGFRMPAWFDIGMPDQNAALPFCKGSVS